MAKIIVIGNQKGGVGKSLLTTMTATALGSEPFKVRVAVIDLDQQSTIYKLRQLDKKAYPQDTLEPFTVYRFKLSEFQKNIAEIDKAFDIVFLDTAGKLDNETDVLQQEISRSLMFADILIIPFVAGFGNLSATFDYVKFVNQVKETRQLQHRQLTVFGMVNQYRARSRANEYLIQDIETMQQTEPINMMKTYVRDFALFKDADTISSLYDAKSTDGAKHNFSEWINELIQIIKN